MKAEIFATGDEIRSGTLVDSNSAYIAEKLEENGVEVTRHHSAGDDLTVLTEVLKEIGGRADIAVVTGGLGPTTDDLSAEVAAKAAGISLKLNEDALRDIRAWFETMGRSMSKSNEKQAVMPDGSVCIKNTAGTAPGFSLKIGKCVFFFLPGVPYEMKKMLSEHVLPEIRKMQGGSASHIMLRTISTFGLPESVVGEKAADVENAFPGIKLGLRAAAPEIQVKLYLNGTDEKSMISTLDRAAAWVSDKIGDHILSMNGTPIEAVVGELLRDKNATLAAAESCTGGLIADMITNVPGSSDYFLFSGVTYSNEAKTKVLGVKPETIASFGAVSEETVREMAEGARRVSGADYAIATSGIAGPDGGTDEKPVGTVCVALAGPGITRSNRITSSYGKRPTFYNSRTMNKKRFAYFALDMLRRELMNV